MFDYATKLRDHLLADLNAESGKSDEDPALRQYIKDSLIAAHSEGRLIVPEGVHSHGMPLGAAIQELDRRNFEGYNLQAFLDWMIRTHLCDITLAASRIRRANPDVAAEDLLPTLAATASELVSQGSFNPDLPDRNHLVESSWSGERAELQIKNWEVIVKPCEFAAMRLGPRRRPISPAPVPGVIEFEMRLHSGKLVIGSDAPLANLRKRHVEMRQSAAAKGLQGSLAVTNSILESDHIIAIPTHRRSLHFVAHEGRAAILSREDVETTPEHSLGDMLLDYRHLFVADEVILKESQREIWDDPDKIVQERYQEQLIKEVAPYLRVSIQPGLYRIRIPANYAHQLPSDPSRFGAPDDVLVEFERIGDR